jgi:hypothetical protein
MQTLGSMKALRSPKQRFIECPSVLAKARSQSRQTTKPDALEIAKERIALAGARLANILNKELK